jgi:spermidine synthase
MAEGLTHPKSTVHVGDGFKFLNDYKNAFDVIITDSSDPEGPAESLFKKSYFELLHGALREGGVISTQGCMSLFLFRESRGVLGRRRSKGVNQLRFKTRKQVFGLVPADSSKRVLLSSPPLLPVVPCCKTEHGRAPYRVFPSCSCHLSSVAVLLP